MVRTKRQIIKTPIKTPTTETTDIKTDAANSINAIATQALINPKNIFFIYFILLEFPIFQYLQEIYQELWLQSFLKRPLPYL